MLGIRHKEELVGLALHCKMNVLTTVNIMLVHSYKLVRRRIQASRQLLASQGTVLRLVIHPLL